MAEQYTETRETTVQDDGTTRTRVVTADAPVRDEKRIDTKSTAQRAVYYIAGVVLSLLALRFILSLLGANRGNGFADFIYTITYPFVAPFFGLFGYEVQAGVSRFEIETLVAMLVYALLAYGIVKLLNVPKRT